MLLDYKSEGNVTKHSLNRVCVLLFEEKSWFTLAYDNQHQPPLASKQYSYNTLIGNPKFNVSDARGRIFFFQNMVRVIEGTII